MESLDCYTNAMQVYCKKDELFGLDVNKGYPHRDVFSRQVDLVYNNI